MFVNSKFFELNHRLGRRKKRPPPTPAQRTPDKRALIQKLLSQGEVDTGLKSSTAMKDTTPVAPASTQSDAIFVTPPVFQRKLF